MHVKIGKKTLGENRDVFVIAEISANHGQDFDTAVKMIRIAKECGANAVKFQAYTPDTMTIRADSEYFQIEHPQWGGQTLYELYKKAYTPWKWFKKLKKVTNDLEIIFLCTAFDKTSVDFLDELDICAHKIASFELMDLDLVEYAAKTKKPLIISTGMASLAEIEEAVNTAKEAGAKDIILLKCISSYPAMAEEMNLRTIPNMRELFNCLVGLSDHSMSIGTSICAVSLGACIIEKHFTLSRGIKTPDSFFSMEPNELKELVDNIRIAEKALGKVHYGSTHEEEKSRIFRRSLFVVKDMKAGETFNTENLRSIRPGYGLSPKYLNVFLGKTVRKNIKKGTPLSWDLI